MPTRDTDALIPAGRTIELDALGAEARTLTVEGTLRASRNTPSELSLFGNLILRQRGMLDYGRPNDHVNTSATIRWYLDERRYVGGAAMAPVATDVGLWAVDDSQVWVHGLYRDTWSSLLETAAAGTTTIRVAPGYAEGWRVGDLVVLTPTNPRGLQEEERPQDERRRIAAVFGPGYFRLDAPLQFAHTVTQVAWTDVWGDAWTEVLAGKVANLTSNITFTAADPNHRPHIMFMDRAKHYVEDLAVVNFGPAPKFVGLTGGTGDQSALPMARYAWHNHTQEAGSRGSYLRRTRLYDGVGDGWHLHESWGVEATDLVVYNQSRFAARINDVVVSAFAPIILESARRGADDQFHAADDCWIDRPLVIGGGKWNDPYNYHGIWTMGSRNCSIVGAVVSGINGQSSSAGIHWIAGGASAEVAHVYRSEVFSNGRMGYFSWQNMARDGPPQVTDRIVDMLSWNNDVGLWWGAYVTEYWAHQVRSIGNRLGLTHQAAGWGITGFLVDGLGRSGALGIEVAYYGGTSTRDSVYEDGVVRGVTRNLAHGRGPDVGRRAWVQFARIRWVPGVGLRLFDGNAAPNDSRVRFRQQQGLPREANFTMYRPGDPGAPAGVVLDTEYNALRVNNDTAGTQPQTPRVRLVGPADDSIATGSITLVAVSNATAVEFYQAHRVLATVPVVGGRATLTFNMAQFSQRRAYFWAQATSGGAVNTSRVLRVRRF